MTWKTRPSVAGERFPHGSPVRVEGDACFLEPELERMHGVTRRPPQTTATHHETGEPVDILTDGDVLAEIDRQACFVTLQDGRIVE